MDIRTDMRRGWRVLRRRGPGKLWLRLLLVGVVAGTLAIGQGLFELFQPEHSLPSSLKSINMTWVLACAITCLGLMITSEAVWHILVGPKVARTGLRAALKMSVRSLGLGPEANVRVAVYVAERPDQAGQRTLYQNFPYVYAHSSEAAYGRGQHGIPETCGIVGHVFRTPDVESLTTFVDAADDEEFIAKLTASPWNMPREMARLVNRDRRSYMALRFSCPRQPNEEPLDGVLYFDAKGPSQQFTDDMMIPILNEQLDILVEHIRNFFR
ncbi:MAG: hypothetical protein WBE26_02965 [Phycisphaerae bacterium]